MLPGRSLWGWSRAYLNGGCYQDVQVADFELRRTFHIQQGAACPGPPSQGRTSLPPRDAPVTALAVLQCRHPQKQFVGSPDDNRTLQ